MESCLYGEEREVERWESKREREQRQGENGNESALKRESAEVRKQEEGKFLEGPAAFFSSALAHRDACFMFEVYNMDTHHHE